MRAAALFNGTVFAIVLLGLNWSGPATASEPDTASIAAYLRAQMRKSGTPGVAVAVVQDGRIVFEAGFGTAGRGRTVDPATLFVLGSVSKPVTSLAVMRLVEAGQLKLDAPVADYLPGFSIGREDGARSITVRHLLQHRSGIPRRAGFQRFDSDAAAPVSYPGVKLNSVPGTTFEYSNLNYVLLGRIVEEVTRESFGSYLHRAVLQPAGMMTAFALGMEGEGAGLATGHAFIAAAAIPWPEPAYSRAEVPAGFIVASAHDMARFLAVQMATPSAPELVSQESLLAMHRPGGEEAYGYAMGWRVVPWRNAEEHLVAHDGLAGRYSAAIGFLPESGLGAVVLTNSNAGVFQSPAATQMLIGTLQIAQGVEPRIRWPVERMVRTVIALLLLLSVLGFVRRFRKWNRKGRPRNLPPLRHLVSDSVGAVLAVAAVLILPAWFGISLDTMLRLQPDLAGVLVLGAAVAIPDAVLKIWLRPP